MSLPIKYRLICEGPSEWTYLQRLSAFIVDKLPPMEDGFTPRLSFFPTVTNDKIGGGSFKLVSRAYRKVCPQNKKVPLRIWVDCDIYIRNSNASERANATGYAQKKTMPDFNFMVMNFEDFVAMHFPDEIFEAWKVEMQNAGHFTVPLHGAVYEPHFEKFWQMYLQSVALGDVESYQKGSLPEDFVTVGSLKNMICHCTDSLLLPLFQRHAPIGPFPQFFVSMGSDPMENPSSSSTRSRPPRPWRRFTSAATPTPIATIRVPCGSSAATATPRRAISTGRRWNGWVLDQTCGDSPCPARAKDLADAEILGDWGNVCLWGQTPWKTMGSDPMENNAYDNSIASVYFAIAGR